MTTLLSDLIVTQAKLTPDAVAIRQWDRLLTFGELTGRAATLAETLQRHGIGPDVLVGICMRREPEAWIAIMGVLMAGGAYVPLDPTHPAARRRLVLEDAGITVAIVDDTGAEVLDGAGLSLLRVPETLTPQAPPNRATPENAAYVMYTSGTSGRPKGVVIAHRNAVQFVTSTAEIFGMDASCRSHGFGALGFDASIMDFFPSLSRGGSIAFVPEADRIDAQRLQRFLEAHEVTWGLFTPALLPLIEPDRIPSLRQVLTGTEAPGPEQVARWSKPPHRRFYNWYGPTECAVVVVGTEMTGQWETTPPIGYPLPNCQAYVLDEAMNPCPDGVSGELYIGGEQVGRGYLARPSLTAEKFVPDPFGSAPGARLYRTGDRAVRDPEHGLVYIGRIDRQVKISGQRVELGEIEAVLRAHPSITHAVADAGEGAAGTLVAYLAPATAPDLPELRDYCADRLPTYMVPTKVVRLDTLPLNASGKVDLHALRALTPAFSDAAAPQPGSVAAIWSRLFGVADPKPDDDFFDCGGHSLLAMRLAQAVRAELGKAISVEDVFAGRTLAGLTERVESAAAQSSSAVRTGNPPKMSTAQRRVWFVDRLAGDTPAYNIAFAERLRGPLDVDRLARALVEVARRHDVLRWRFPDTAGVPRVVVDPPGHPVPMTIEDAREEDVEARLETEARQRFDLAHDSLWRALVLRLGEHDHVLALTIHHTVVDGYSQEMLYHDIARAYAGETLEPLPASFADYVAWLEDRDPAESDTRWWAEQLRGAATVLDLPRDRPRPAVQTFRGARAHGEITPAMADTVRDVARAVGATPYAVLLSAFGQMLRRLTGEHELIVGVPVADRGNEIFAPMVGFCVDTVPLRLSIRDDAGFDSHVTECADALTGALSRSGVPLDRIVSALNVERDLTRNPLVQVLFNMYNFSQPTLSLPGIEAETAPAGLPGALFDLTLYFAENARHGWDLQAVYNPDLFDAPRIEDLLAGYLALVNELTANPQAEVGRARMRAGAADLAELPHWTGPGLLERVEATAGAKPDAVAVTGEGGDLTYGEVLELQRRTTAAIRLAGIAPGEAIGILATRHTHLPALMLGVLASGARWAMLDASYPPGRIAALAREAGCVALVACPGVTPSPDLADLPVIAVGAESSPEVAPRREYLSFTSGTTGRPKVVLANDLPLSHFLDWYPHTFALTGDDHFAMLGGVSHDPLLRDIFTPLVLGATLHVPQGDLPRDPVRLIAWLAGEGITVTHMTPQLVRLLTGVPGAHLPALRLAACGGDQLTMSDVDKLRRLAPRARVLNLYGTTETPQAQAFHEPAVDAQGSGPVPVGRGIEGAQLLVLGPQGQPAGVGELGEVIIRSRHLAIGYVSGGVVDAQRFADGRYATGDLGRYRPDGAVVLAGRRDDQVKVRGFRLEPGEVEAALLSHPKVRTVAVTVGIDHGEVQLHAFVVMTDGGFGIDALRAHLADVLPGYAMPATLTAVPAIPLTPNGKVDRSALPRTTPGPAATGAQEPSTATERLIASAWREVLSLPRVGVSDNFFQIGGHSLAVAAVQARLTSLLGREIDILDLFRYPNIRALAAHLDGAASTPALDRAAQRVAARRDRGRRSSSPTRAQSALDEKGRDK